ncbi:hypothetical protein [Sorangium sp. So ce128]|uniref:hypothetical protein n=1 Tax=Sorangium sp. So ce128 TaxID=3133281 RepID=UPI003F5FCBD3
MVYCLHHAERNRRLIPLFFLAAGLSGVTAASLFGLAMHRAIAPRIRRMVTAVQRFLQGIARLHGARFWIERSPDDLMVFSLELRR